MSEFEKEPKGVPPVKMHWLGRDWVPMLRGQNGEVKPGRVAATGFAAFLVLYLLGALSPALPSPIFTKVEALMVEHEKKTEAHTAALLKPLRTLCLNSVPPVERPNCL